MSNPKNIKILTREELDYLVGKYLFRMLNPEIIGVKTTTCIRENTHPINEKFAINTPIKRITISPEAIDYWNKLNGKYHLIEVQNAINVLTVMYQEISEKTIVDQIENMSTKIIEK